MDEQVFAESIRVPSIRIYASLLLSFFSCSSFCFIRWSIIVLYIIIERSERMLGKTAHTQNTQQLNVNIKQINSLEWEWDQTFNFFFRSHNKISHEVSNTTKCCVKNAGNWWNIWISMSLLLQTFRYKLLILRENKKKINTNKDKSNSKTKNTQNWRWTMWSLLANERNWTHILQQLQFQSFPF